MTRSARQCCWTLLSALLCVSAGGAARAQTWLEYAPELEDDRPLSSEQYGLSDYLELPELLASEANPATNTELRAALHWIWADSERDLAMGVLEEPLTAAELRAELRAGLGIASMVDDLEDRSLRFAVLDEHYGAAHSDQLLLFEDPLVGRFAARILLPDGPGPHPILLALPGHDRDVYEFCVEFSCQSYLQAGYALAVLQLRVDESGELEHRTAAYLLSEGFNLAGLHVYEAMQLARYLRSQSQVDSSQMALLGHSGGAVLAGMLAFLDGSFAALVSDTTAVFTEDMEGGLLCSTSDLLYPYHPQLARFDLLPAARLYQYGYPEGSTAVVRFLDERFGRRGGDAAAQPAP
jgi:hypothetical protein